MGLQKSRTPLNDNRSEARSQSIPKTLALHLKTFSRTLKCNRLTIFLTYSNKENFLCLISTASSTLCLLFYFIAFPLSISCAYLGKDVGIYFTSKTSFWQLFIKVSIISCKVYVISWSLGTDE